MVVCTLAKQHPVTQAERVLTSPSSEKLLPVKIMVFNPNMDMPLSQKGRTEVWKLVPELKRRLVLDSVHSQMDHGGKL